MKKSSFIIVRAIKCLKCGQIIFSRSRHDFHWCKCRSIAIDGGFDYLKVTGNLENFIEKRIKIKATKKQLYLDYSLNKNEYGYIEDKSYQDVLYHYNIFITDKINLLLYSKTQYTYTKINDILIKIFKKLIKSKILKSNLDVMRSEVICKKLKKYDLYFARIENLTLIKGESL